MVDLKILSLKSPLPFTDKNNKTCACGLPIVKRTVTKESPNKGREFDVCSNDRDSRCGYIKYVDDAQSMIKRGGKEDTPPGKGKGGESSKRTAPSGPGGNPPKKRKCGACGIEGHNRKNCPNS